MKDLNLFLTSFFIFVRLLLQGVFPVTNNTHTSENILWSAEYYVDYHRNVIGVYKSEEEAYTAYTAKMEELGDD